MFAAQRIGLDKQSGDPHIESQVQSGLPCFPNSERSLDAAGSRHSLRCGQQFVHEDYMCTIQDIILVNLAKFSKLLVTY